jgi:hypothetical protein
MSWISPVHQPGLWGSGQTNRVVLSFGGTGRAYSAYSNAVAESFFFVIAKTRTLATQPWPCVTDRRWAVFDHVESWSG